MPNFICTTCGTQYAKSEQPPAACTICEEPRQYVKKTGQQWTTLERLRVTNRNALKLEEPGLIGIGIDPPFAIGQRALFLRTPKANVLWDCLPLLDEHEEFVRRRGGLGAIAISHPHYYTTMVEWAHAFGCPVLVHESDREWVLRPDPSVELWSGDVRRSLTLPFPVDSDRADARFEQGILRVALPKAESAKPRKITIGSGKEQAALNAGQPQGEGSDQ